MPNNNHDVLPYRVIEDTWRDQDKYEMATIQPFPDDCLAFRQTKGFHKAVRANFLRKLPTIFLQNHSVEKIVCAWCLEEITHCATHVDHIIPKATYLRYRFYEEIKKDAVLPGTNITELMREFLHEKVNLIIACTSCNLEKSDHMPTDDQLAALEGFNDNTDRGPAILEKVALARTIKAAHVDQINDPVLYHFLNHGASESTFTHVLRHAPSAESRRFFLEYPKLAPGENVIRGWTGTGSKMPFTAKSVRPDLAVQQKVGLTADWSGKLCFYCLGVYEEDAFQIDHIRATNGNTLTVEENNRSFNLFPVCGPCNRAKKATPLSPTFLLNRINARLNSNHPGIESAGWYQQEKDAIIRTGFLHQLNIFRTKFSGQDYGDVTEQAIDDWIAQNRDYDVRINFEPDDDENAEPGMELEDPAGHRHGMEIET